MSVYVLSAVRTPIGKFGGSLKGVSPAELFSTAIRGALERAGINGNGVNLVIGGNVLRASHGQDITRQASIMAGIPVSVDGFSLDMVCSSGMMSIGVAHSLIASGAADIVVAGGTESMSQSAFCISHRARWGMKHLIGSSVQLEDIMVKDGLTDPFNGLLMGQEADLVAKLRGVKREQLDEVALESHVRAARAADSGEFSREMVPVKLTNGSSVEKDEGIRRDTSMDKLAALRPAFGDDGLHTAGTSSQIADGAAALLLASERYVDASGIRPIARITGYSWIGVDSYRFVEAPPLAIKALLERTKTSLDEYDLFENNEAFAVSTIVFENDLGIKRDRINVFGGAIALGHPIGASGARIVVTLLNALRSRGGKRGIASLCHGIGGATALAVELV